MHNNTDNIDTTLFTAKSKTYDKLQHYYLDLLKNIDFIHFNSYLTRNVFLNFFRPNKYIVNFISTSSIKDNRFSHNKIVDDTFINFVILGDNQGAYDVFNYFDKLWALGYSNFHLTIYTRNFVESKPYLTTKGSYIFSDLPLILDNADALIYNESSFATFSFIVLEALSFGVPCIVCGKVGAKDIVALNDCGFVIDTPSELGELLLYILKYPLSLADKQKNLLNANINFEQDDFIDIYRNLISEN